MSPEKNNMKTKEKNAKAKAKEPVTSAEEEEGERIKAKKAALRGRRVSKLLPTRSRFPLTRIYL